MLILDLTLDSPAANIALDEALLLEAEETAGANEVLRIWESSQTFVVVGSSSKASSEVNLSNCRADRVPVLRRASGGAAILTGPGCLMYAVLLSYDRHPHLRAVDLAHRHVLGRLAPAIGRHIAGVHQAGTSDLALHDRKFSGNSLRCKRSHLVYHGTLLYGFPLDRIEHYLRLPERQPEYRQGRSHGNFVVNLPLDRTTLVAALRNAFQAGKPMRDWPRDRMARLVMEKYTRDEWNLRM